MAEGQFSNWTICCLEGKAELTGKLDSFTKAMEDIQDLHLEALKKDRFGTSGGLTAQLPAFSTGPDDGVSQSVRMLDANLKFNNEPGVAKGLVTYYGGILEGLGRDAKYNCPRSFGSGMNLGCYVGFMVADWSQTLLPDEAIVHVGRGVGFLSGYVAITRCSPTNVASDIRIFKALSHQEVRSCFKHLGGPPLAFEGLVTLSAHADCTRAPADYMAGGDYDGDRVVVISNEKLLQTIGLQEDDKGFKPAHHEPNTSLDLEAKMMAQVFSDPTSEMPDTLLCKGCQEQLQSGFASQDAAGHSLQPAGRAGSALPLRP